MRSLYRQKRRKDISGELESKDLSLSMIPVESYLDEREGLEKDMSNIASSIDMNGSEDKTVRYYNGLLPSSNYPSFNESRVNLIE